MGAAGRQVTSGDTSRFRRDALRIGACGFASPAKEEQLRRASSDRCVVEGSAGQAYACSSCQADPCPASTSSRGHVRRDDRDAVRQRGRAASADRPAPRDARRRGRRAGAASAGPPRGGVSDRRTPAGGGASITSTWTPTEFRRSWRSSARSDTRGRREVVAQMLDYAANAKTSFSAERMAAWLEEDAQAARNHRCRGAARHVRRRGSGRVLGDRRDEPRRRAVAADLRLGRHPARAAPDHRVPQRPDGPTEVLAIEVKQYVDDQARHQTIVPRVIGNTETAKRTKRARSSRRATDRTSLLAALAEGDPVPRTLPGRCSTGASSIPTCRGALSPPEIRRRSGAEARRSSSRHASRAHRSVPGRPRARVRSTARFTASGQQRSK